MPGEIYCDDCLIEHWVDVYKKNLPFPLPELACGHPIYNGVTVDGVMVCGLCTGMSKNGQ